MKLKHIIFTFLLPVLLITSCKREQDRIFEENASVRMTEAIANAYGVLQGNEAGWVMTYYPSDNQEFGGYTIFTKFISNAQVTMVSDAIESSETSTYSVIHDTGPVLSFNGYNKAIHWFSEPGMDNGRIGADDTGMKGDFEFIVLKATADSVVLKGKKSGTEVVMLPLSGDEFEQQGEAYQEAAAQFGEFGVFKLEDASGDLLDMPYSSPIRVFRNPKDASGNEMSFRVIPGGLEFYAEQEMEGVTFKTLKFVEPTTAYPYGYYTNDNATFKIVPDITPLNVWFRTNTWAMRYSGLGAEGQYWWSQGRTRFQNFGYTLNYVDIGDFSTQIAPGFTGFAPFLSVNGQSSAAYFGYNMVPVNGTVDEISFAFTGSYYSTAAFDIAYWSNAIVYLVQMLNNRTFVITSDQLEKPSVMLLTDKEDPTNTIELILNGDIYDPLNN
ncbi:DUF4302 domain-containing protein [Sphingobacterium corticibacterium]|uniref:DUF4302 domain-containing protein n=1 Tax=Sphingobacterium corticibacterium TaxID=2484746 RepID=A0A4Q6XQQ0_9SPHI|nr:DUF4302 domain-containing protein [Sphingobacterium corticibacterium]RZF59762.1 DUF4302 domain-containing protein [Sphingobacterium corticibacterium]